MAVGRCYGCGAAALGTYLYAFGGEDVAVEEPQHMTMYNMATRKVEEVAKPPRALVYCAGVACGGLVYSLGGYDVALQSPAASVHAYNPDIDSWVDGPALPMAVSDTAAAEHMGCIYMCGGWMGVRAPPSDSLLMLDPRTRAWATLPAMPTPVAAARAAAVVAGRMYMPGGATGEVPLGTSALPTLQSYDLAAGCWDTSCTPMAQARMAHAVAALHGEVWAVGGEDNECHMASVEVYRPRLNAWRSGVSLPLAWSHGACAVVQC